MFPVITFASSEPPYYPWHTHTHTHTHKTCCCSEGSWNPQANCVQWIMLLPHSDSITSVTSDLRSLFIFLTSDWGTVAHCRLPDQWAGNGASAQSFPSIHHMFPFEFSRGSDQRYSTLAQKIPEMSCLWPREWDNSEDDPGPIRCSVVYYVWPR